MPNLTDFEQDEAVLTEKKEKLEKPKLFKVILHNDDYTTMEFVIEVLQRFFSIDSERAQQLMLQIHNSGSAVCGVYTRDVAETKVAQVTEYARQNGHPLRCSMEEV